MMFLLGKQAIFGHAPPMYFRSIEAVRLPSLAIVHAINLPAAPLPSTRTSYFSGSLMPLISFCGLMFCLGDGMSIGVTAARAVVLVVFMRETRCVLTNP